MDRSTSGKIDLETILPLKILPYKNYANSYYFVMHLCIAIQVIYIQTHAPTQYTT